MELLLIIPVILYATFQAICNKWHDVERDTTTEEARKLASSKWHFWQGAEHIVVFVFAIASMLIGVWYVYPMLAFLYWFMFDGIRAKTLNKRWLYLGENSKLDTWGKITNIMKIGGLVLSTSLYIIFKFVV